MMIVDEISLQLNLRVKTNYAPLQLDGMICRSILILMERSILEGQEWNIERSILMERYEKTGHSILYQITHNNIKLHKNQSLKIWTEFRLNFADRWIILWWRRWKPAPSISINHNHYPVFPLYFLLYCPCLIVMICSWELKLFANF